MTGEPTSQAGWEFLGGRVAVLAPFPPAEDGIGRYADQLAAALAADREVLRIGLPVGGGDRVVDPLRGLRALRLARHVRGCDDLLVMYHPEYYAAWGGRFAVRLASYVTWALLVRVQSTSFVVHEPEQPAPVAATLRARVKFAFEERARRVMWAGARRAVFHSDWERRRFAARFPSRRRRDHVVAHGEFFTPAATASRAEARDRLGLRHDRVILTCLGFLSPERPDKGYDRAVRAVRDAGRAEVELHIVGSKIRSGPDIDRYVEELGRLVDQTPGAHLHNRFVPDEEFDLWVRAADAVVVPYRESASSSVVARARLLGTRVITSAVGGIGEQLGPDDVRFETDVELADVIRDLAAAPAPGA